MPSSAAENAPIYTERLAVRPHWWFVTLICTAFGSAELFAGFGWPIIIIALLALLVPMTVLLAGMSRSVLRVDEVGVHVGSRMLRYDEIESVEGLDRDRTRMQLGPLADPSAYLVVRGWIPQSVLIRLLDAHAVPYWLVSTRDPAAVVAAVERLARVSFA